MDEIDKLTQEHLQREAERLIKSGEMPALEDLCAAVVDARKKYANQVRRARREAPEKVVVDYPHLVRNEADKLLLIIYIEAIYFGAK